MSSMSRFVSWLPGCSMFLFAGLMLELGTPCQAADVLRSFVIEATPPDVTGPDLRGPDFSNCDGIGDAFGQTFVDFDVPNPNAPHGREVHNDGTAVHRSVRDPKWWRDTDATGLMTMSGFFQGNFREEIAIRGALHWHNGVGFPEILSFFEDGGVRPDAAADIPQTGTVRFGPMEFNDERGRRYADVKSIDMLADGRTLEFNYENGEKARLIVEQATPQKSRFRVEVEFAPDENGLLIETTNMFRDALVNDTALVRSVDMAGNELIHPVMEFPGGLLTEVTLFRDQHSTHNSLGPDIRIGEFMFEDDDGNLFAGPLLIENESVVTDCAEEDNVVIAFSVPEPSAGIMALMALCIIAAGRGAFRCS